MNLYFLILIFLGGIGGLIYLHIRRVGPAKAAAAWPVAPGTMLATTVREPAPGAGDYQPLVHYRYQVGGRDLEGVQLRLGDTSTSDRDRAYAHIGPYPPGTPVQVRYNPQRPEQSVLELVPVSSPFLLIAGGLLLFLLLGIGAIAALESGLFEQDSVAYPVPASITSDLSPAGSTEANSDTGAATTPVDDLTASMIGRWGRNGDCARPMQFLAGGVIINPNGERGTWEVRPVSARQSALTISGGGSTSRAWLDRVGPGYQVTAMDGSGNFIITRC